MSSKSSRRIVIIGGVATGPKAAARIRRLDPDAEIIIIEQGEYFSYASCGLPYLVAGAVPGVSDLLTTPWGEKRDADFFKRTKNIEVRNCTRALSINREMKVLKVEDLQNGSKYDLPYDKLVIATGAEPVKLDIPVDEYENVFGAHSIDQAQRIIDYINDMDVENAVVVGAGLIGLEMVDALSAMAVEATLIESQQHIAPYILDPEMATLLKANLEKMQVKVIAGQRIVDLEGENKRANTVITDKSRLQTEMIILCTGMKPNVRLAQQAGLKIGETGAITVNQFMQTSDPDIYAGGDCIENIHKITGKPYNQPLSGSTANRHGRIIGSNICGIKETLPPVVGTVIFKTMGMNMGKVGLGEREAINLGYETICAYAPTKDKAHYFPGGKPFIIKLIADRKTQRLLGAQFLGSGEISKRLDVVATALYLGASIDDLSSIELGYSPPFSGAIHGLTHAANTMRNKIELNIPSMPIQKIKQKIKLGEDFILLDVRTTAEFDKGSINDPRTRNIPLDQLRGRLKELPSDTQIITFCKIGARGYEAAKLLRDSGLRNACFMDGGFEMWW